MMRHRQAVSGVARTLLLALALLGASGAVQAQPASRTTRIGFLGIGTLADTANRLEAFQQGPA
jgi:hypothetical protein